MYSYVSHPHKKSKSSYQVIIHANRFLQKIRMQINIHNTFKVHSNRPHLGGVILSSSITGNGGKQDSVTCLLLSMNGNSMPDKLRYKEGFVPIIDTIDPLLISALFGTYIQFDFIKSKA